MDNRSVASAPSRIGLQRSSSTDQLERAAALNLEQCLYGVTAKEEILLEEGEECEESESEREVITLNVISGKEKVEDAKEEEGTEEVVENDAERTDEKIETNSSENFLSPEDECERSISSLDALDIVDNENKTKKRRKQKRKGVRRWHDSCTAEDWHRRPGMWKENHHIIDLKLLRKIVTSGIVDEGSHRAVAWRVLFGYLPPDNSKWEKVLEKQRKHYYDLVHDLFIDTTDIDHGDSLKGRRRRGSLYVQRKRTGSMDSADSISDDDSSTPSREDGSAPMPSFDSKRPIPKQLTEYWKRKQRDLKYLERIAHELNALRMDKFMDDDNPADDEDLEDFFESVNLLDEIHKDVIRTHPHLNFFLEPASHLGLRRYAAIERVLFVWSKYNKGVGYVQGMNEIIGILYYVLANDQNDEWAAAAEPDAYGLLHLLFAEIQDIFIPDLDNADTGIQGRIQTMRALLERHDPEVLEHLDELNLQISYFAIRWWTTLLSREFLLPDTIRLWDSMFASTHKDNYLRYVCVTMIMVVRDELLHGDFSTCLRLLQAYPSTHIDQLLESSRALWLYESQVTVACHRGGISLHQALCTIKSPPALVMAFGLKKGKPPESRAERARVQAGKTVANAGKSMATSAVGMFGRARGLYQRVSMDLRGRAKSEDSVLDSASADGACEEIKTNTSMDNSDLTNVVTDKLEEDVEDDPYLKAILNA